MSQSKIFELSQYIYSEIIKCLPLKDQVDYQVLDKNWRDATKVVFRNYQTLILDDVSENYHQVSNLNNWCDLHNHHFRGPTIIIKMNNFDAFFDEKVIMNFPSLNTIDFSGNTFDIYSFEGNHRKLPSSVEHVHLELRERYFSEPEELFVSNWFLSLTCVSTGSLFVNSRGWNPFVQLIKSNHATIRNISMVYCPTKLFDIIVDIVDSLEYLNIDCVTFNGIHDKRTWVQEHFVRVSCKHRKLKSFQTQFVSYEEGSEFGDNESLNTLMILPDSEFIINTNHLIAMLDQLPSEKKAIVS